MLNDARNANYNYTYTFTYIFSCSCTSNSSCSFRNNSTRRIAPAPDQRLGAARPGGPVSAGTAQHSRGDRPAQGRCHRAAAGHARQLTKQNARDLPLVGRSGRR